MVVNQIYGLINSVAQQAFGETAVAVTNLQGLISLGDTVLSSETSTDAFLNTLVDRIGRTIIRTLDVELQFRNIMMDNFEFGAVLQKITVEPMQAQQNDAWNVGTQGFTPTLYKIDKPTVRQSLFSGITTWEIDLTVPDKLFRTAFTDASAMGALINGIIDAMDSSMRIRLNGINHLAVNNFLGEKIASGKNVINLYTEFAPASGTTVQQLLRNPDFYKFAGKRMKDIMDYMRFPSVMYNEEGVVRATPRDNMHVWLLSEFASGYSTYLSSDTFHNELVSLPLYEEVTYWQGLVHEESEELTTAPSFEDSSKIILTTSSGESVSQGGIIGAFVDRQAIGTTIYDLYTSTDRNNRNRYTNYTSQADIGHYNDLSENGVVFIVSTT